MTTFTPTRSRFYQETPPAVAPDPKPLPKSERLERPVDEPTFGRDVVAVTLLFVAPAFVGTWAWLGDVWLAIAAGCAVGTGVAFWRVVYVYDPRLTAVIEEREWYPPIEPAAAAPVIEAWVRHDNGNGNGTVITRGNLEYRAAEWRKLAAALLPAERVTREVVNAAGVIPNITRNYNAFVAALSRLGWLEGNQLTEAGREWFERWR